MGVGERFARQQLVGGWDQSRLQDASVAVIGVGALGNEVARLLAMAGVGALVLCDHDVVAASNLSRGVLFRDADIGRPKVDVAASALRELAPHTVVRARAQRFVNAVGLTELRDASLVVSCLDSREGRLQLMGRCALASVGMLDGATNDWGGEVGWYEPGGPCFGCGMSAAERAAVDGAVSCLGAGGPAGASGAVSALVGSLVAVLALRLLMGAPVAPRVLSIDAAGGRMARVYAGRDPDCPLHERVEPDDVSELALGNAATVGEILDHVEPGETLFAWASTGAGGLVLGAEQASATLEQLGVAPGELLPVLRGDRTRYLALAAATGAREGAIR